MNARQAFGRAAEEAAARHLAGARLAPARRNVRVGRGELDIIARRGPVLAFVEVKARRTRTCGAPEDAVDPRKRRQIARLAELWLAARPWALAGVDDVRFDIVAVDAARLPVECATCRPPSRRTGRPAPSRPLRRRRTGTRARPHRQRGAERPRGSPRRGRGRRRRRGARLQHRGPARRRRAGEPRARARGDRQLGLRVPLAAHHRQPGSGRPAQGGPSFDLPIALAFLVATGQAADGCDGRGPLAAVGELGLDGSLRPVAGALALAESLRRRGVRGLLLPAANAAEASLVAGPRGLPGGARWRRPSRSSRPVAATAAPPADLRALLEGVRAARTRLRRHRRPGPRQARPRGRRRRRPQHPHDAARRAPARRCWRAGSPASCRALTAAEAIEVTRIYSVAGLLPHGQAAGHARGRSARRITPSRRPASSAAAARRGRARSASRTSACCSSTSSPSSGSPRSRDCGSRSRTARSRSAGGSRRSPSRRASCWSRP